MQVHALQLFFWMYDWEWLLRYCAYGFACGFLHWSLVSSNLENRCKIWLSIFHDSDINNLVGHSFDKESLLSEHLANFKFIFRQPLVDWHQEHGLKTDLVNHNFFLSTNLWSKSLAWQSTLRWMRKNRITLLTIKLLLVNLRLSCF